jgi:hypothetical protein
MQQENPLNRIIILLFWGDRSPGGYQVLFRACIGLRE